MERPDNSDQIPHDNSWMEPSSSSPLEGASFLQVAVILITSIFVPTLVLPHFIQAWSTQAWRDYTVRGLLTVWCLVTQSCPTLYNLVNCNPLGSSIHGILQARILEWVAISSSRGSSQPRDGTPVPCESFTANGLFYCWVTGEFLGSLKQMKTTAKTGNFKKDSLDFLYYPKVW